MKSAILLALLLSACSTSKAITLPDGKVGQLVQCNGTMNSIGGCYEAAGKACPAGYAIVDSQSEGGMLTVPNGKGGVNHYPTAARTMLISCK